MKFEVLGRNNQFVAHGIHPSGAGLEWEGDISPAFGLKTEDLPVVTEEQVVEVLELIAPLIGAQPPSVTRGSNASSSTASASTGVPHDGNMGGEQTADPVDVAAALAAIPNEGPADWTFWKKVGLAAWAATTGSPEGFAAWLAWSAKNPAHIDEACEEAWEDIRRSPPDRIGAGSLFKMAQDAIPGWRAPSWDAQRKARDSAASGSTHMLLPPGFEMTPAGLFFMSKAKVEDDPPERTWISAPFDVLGMCRDGAGGGWGKVLRRTDKANITHEQIVPQKCCQGGRRAIRSQPCLNRGGWSAVQALRC